MPHTAWRKAAREGANVSRRVGHARNCHASPPGRGGLAEEAEKVEEAEKTDCRGKVESSGFRRVSDVAILSLFPAIPSKDIVLHRGHPSRLPFGAQPRRGLDGARPRCVKQAPEMREWQAVRWRRRLEPELSTLPDRNSTLLRQAEKADGVPTWRCVVE